MKTFKKLLFVFVILVGMFTLVGCGKEKDSFKETTKEEKTIDTQVIGTWDYTEEDVMTAIYVLNEDGTGTYTITVGENTVEKTVEYYTKDGVLYINYDGEEDTYELPYSIKDGDLVIVDSLGEDVVYVKK